MFHLLCARLQLEEALKGFWPFTNNACSIKKVDNAVIPIRRAMFFHLNATSIIHFLRVFGMPNSWHGNDTVLLKDPLNLRFSKMTQKTNSVTKFFF